MVPEAMDDTMLAGVPRLLLLLLVLLTLLLQWLPPSLLRPLPSEQHDHGTR